MANYFCTDSVEEQVDYLTGKIKELKNNKSNATNLENGTGTGSIQQKGITYDKLITDYEPNMVAYVSYIGAGVSSPTSEQLIALLNSDKTNPYVAQILGNYTFEQYCAGFLAGTGAIQSGVSNKTAIDSLIAGALEGYGLTPSSDLSNIVGKAGSASAILGAMNKAFSPGAFAGGVGCEAGDEGYPGDTICSFAYGSNVKTKSICSVGIGRDLENLGDTSAVFGRGNKEYKIEGNEYNKQDQRIYLDNLKVAGGDVKGNGNNRVGIAGVNKGVNSLIAGNGHWNGAQNSTILGNQNIIGKNNINDGNPCANNFIGNGLINFIDRSDNCAILGRYNRIVLSRNTNLFGSRLKAEGRNAKTVVGYYNEDKADTYFEVGNGTSDTGSKNAFEVLIDGRAKVQSAPKDNDDVVRKGDLANIGGGNLYRHDIKIVCNNEDSIFVYLVFYTSNSTLINTIDKIRVNSNGDYVDCVYSGFDGGGSVYFQVNNATTFNLWGAIVSRGNPSVVSKGEFAITPTQITDTVTQI